MAYTNIDDPSANFQTKTYSGNSTDDTAITNDGNSNLQPDFVWFKRRNSATNHILQDSNRGVTKNLESDNTAAEYTATSRIKSFDTDGVTLGTSVGVNGSGYTYVAWQWKANGGTTSSNTDGNITSTVQANTDAGFSIITYTGNGSNNQTIGHGLGVKPTWWIVKRREAVASWNVGSSLGPWGGTSNYMLLNGTQANSEVNNIWGDSAPNSTIIRVSDDASLNASSGTYVAYVFANKQGFQKCGFYTGNGDANGTFVYTGFKPAFVMIKRNDASNNWLIYDHKRSGYNPKQDKLYPDSSSAEDASTTSVDLLSNGFKLRASSASQNASGGTYIYMAFASSPFTTSTGIPTTAR